MQESFACTCQGVLFARANDVYYARACDVFPRVVSVLHVLMTCALASSYTCMIGFLCARVNVVSLHVQYTEGLRL